MAVEGNRVEAGVRRGMAKLMAHAMRRGDGGSSGGARLEIAGERRRWGSTWRARGRGEGRGAADFEGEWGGVLGVVAAVFRGTEWGRGAGSWVTRSHGRAGVVQGGGGGRGKRFPPNIEVYHLLTEHGGPHRETAQAPLCRFGPLGSVTPYSCVLVDLCVKEYRELESEPEFRPGMVLTGTNIPTPGVSTPAPARDESQEALIIPTGRGEACDRPPVAT
ncbi:XS domain containing protein-like [Oryza sativa Japonica Group]|uniref:XS domain containing protein-like n=1 Tax=Oryza sativa subsp. japonica TaxID=39947 RepID=Q5VNG9_ORYSJ|nr:XS domain containing protein-like [Oryza sativa Japonica Group]